MNISCEKIEWKKLCFFRLIFGRCSPDTAPFHVRNTGEFNLVLTPGCVARVNYTSFVATYRRINSALKCFVWAQLLCTFLSIILPLVRIANYCASRVLAMQNVFGCCMTLLNGLVQSLPGQICIGFTLVSFPIASVASATLSEDAKKHFYVMIETVQ